MYLAHTVIALNFFTTIEQRLFFRINFATVFLQHCTPAFFQLTDILVAP